MAYSVPGQWKYQHFVTARTNMLVRGRPICSLTHRRLSCCRPKSVHIPQKTRAAYDGDDTFEAEHGFKLFTRPCDYKVRP